MKNDVKLIEIQINEIHMYCHTQGIKKVNKAGLLIKLSYSHGERSVNR